METERREAEYEHDVVLGHEPPQNRRPRGVAHGASWLWLHHLYSQIRRGSPGRTDGLQALRHPEYGQGRYVLNGNRHRRSRRHFWWWRNYARPLTLCSIAFLLIVSGCRKPDWQQQHTQAVADYRSGNSGGALILADAALRQDGKIDPSWVWKFRILKAEILLRRDAANQAEMLLELPIPPNLPSEVVADEKMVQAQALCTLKRGAEAHRLLEAGSVRAGTRSVHKPDLEFILGYCAFAEGDHTLARQHFQNSALSAHGIDAYAEARGLGALGY